MQLTFLYELGPLYALLDLICIRQVFLAGECLVQAGPEVVVSLRVVSSHE